MITRRFLLASTAAVPVSRMLPPAKVVGDIGASTWGAGIERLAFDYYATGLRAGFMTVAEVRAAEGFHKLDLQELLR